MFSKNKSGVQASTEASTGRPVKQPGVPSIVSEDLVVTGNLKSEGDIQIDGRVEGDVESRTLTVGESAEVRGAVTAEAIRVCGTVNGEVRGHKVVLTRSARVRGDVLHETLEIEAGAFLEGHCRRLTGDELRAQASGTVGARTQQRDAAAAKARAGVVAGLAREDDEALAGAEPRKGGLLGQPAANGSNGAATRNS